MSERELCFDLDGTLVFTNKAYIRDVLNRVFSEKGLQAPNEMFMSLFLTEDRKDLVERELIRQESQIKPWEILKPYNIRFQEKFISETFVYEDAAETLARLPKVSIVTNLALNLALEILNRTGLERYVPNRVLSNDGIRLSKGEVLKNYFGKRTNGNAYVGDLFSDLDAARDANLQGILITRTGEFRNPVDAREIRTLTELLS